MAHRAAQERDAVTAVPALPGAPHGTFTPAWVGAQFRRIDDGAGGPLQTLRRSVKFWVRCVWHAAPMRVSVSTFANDSLSSVVQGEPAVQSRPLRAYLRNGLTAAHRAQAVHEHFTWLSNNIPSALIDALYVGGPVTLLASEPGRPGLSLSRASGLGREGELALHLVWNGEIVMSLAFSVLEPSTVAPRGRAGELRGSRAVVGAVQGRRGADAGLREMSAACQRLRPSALLLIALQGMSRAWGLQAPLCVSAGSHVYVGYKSVRRKAQLDYDAIWQESSAVAMGAHYWLLPVRPVLRPDGEVESRKRAQHRRRNVLREGFFDAAWFATHELSQAGSQSIEA